MNEKNTNLPVLTGSEKQIKWAKDIRADYLNASQKFDNETDKNLKEAYKRTLLALGNKLETKSVEAYRDELLDADPELEKYSGMRKTFRATRKAQKLHDEASIEVARKAITTETRASFWIDNRLG